MSIYDNNNSFEASMFYKMNRRINKGLPYIYSATLLVSLTIIYIGK
ncbi:hypothetical protein ACMC56_07245 [Campylobacterota bacterium DY0563]